MKNKVFIVSFIMAVALNAFFFKVFRIMSPRVISIMESEVVFVEAADSAPGLQLREDSGDQAKAGQSFSLPGVYQKIYSPDMPYTVQALRQDTPLAGKDPYEDVKKLVSYRMKFDPVLPAGNVGLAGAAAAALTEPGIQSGKNLQSITLSTELAKHFDEEAMGKAFSEKGVRLTGSCIVRVTFRGKRDLSVLVEGDTCSAGPGMLREIFLRTRKPSPLAPDRISGKIGLRDSDDRR
jgi:hypothetical protein